MDLNGYEIHVTEQVLPHLDSAWTKIDANCKSFYFERDNDKTMVFNISGYISKATWTETREEAEGLNLSLINQPSGVFTDGYGTEYACLVEDWEITPIAAQNKYLFTMTCRIVV